MTINENGFNKVQINFSEDRATDGSLIKRSLLLNVRENSVEKAFEIYSALREKIEEKEDNSEKKVSQEKSEIPSCPKCGKPMILRQNGKKGDFFWGCSTYPRCRGTKQYQTKKEYPAENEEIPVVDL